MLAQRGGGGAPAALSQVSCSQPWAMPGECVNDANMQMVKQMMASVVLLVIAFVVFGIRVSLTPMVQPCHWRQIVLLGDSNQRWMYHMMVCDDAPVALAGAAGQSAIS